MVKVNSICYLSNGDTVDVVAYRSLLQQPSTHTHTLDQTLSFLSLAVNKLVFLRPAVSRRFNYFHAWLLIIVVEIRMNQMEGCGKFIKYAVFIVNFIIMLGGLVICGVGIWTLVDRAYVEQLLDTNLYVSSAAIIVAMGAFIAIVSFMGCCGALKEVKCLLVTFFIILLLVFIILLVGAILGFVMKDQVSDYLTRGMNATMIKYGTDEKYKAITNAWDDAQSELKCCGIHEFKNWEVNQNFKDHSVPKSCCKEPNVPCEKNPSTQNVFNEGCYDKVKELIKQHSGPLAGIAIAIAVILILGMIFSCALFLMI